MNKRLKSSLFYLFFAFVVNWIIYGVPNTDTDDSIVGKMFANQKIEYNHREEKVEILDRNWEEIIKNLTFKAISQMAIRRKSWVIGQIYDYLRIKGEKY